MKHHIISYATGGYKNSFPRLRQQAHSTGWFDTIKTLSYDDLPQDYTSRFKFPKNNRGAGFWTWKPWLVNDHINNLTPGDILVWSDAQNIINIEGQSRYYEYIEMLNSSDLGCISFQFTAHPSTPDILWRENEYTYEETFEYFDIPTNSKHATTGQIAANCIIFKVNEHAKFLCNEWVDTLKRRVDLFTDEYIQHNKSKNSFFKDNRHDQSIFSLIRKKHGSITLSDETLFPHGLGDDNFYTDGTNIKYPFWKYAPPEGWKFE